MKDSSRRYIWFSSTFADAEDRSNMYINGTGAGAPLDVVYPEKIKHTTLFITEGRFKAKKDSKYIWMYCYFCSRYW